VDLWVQNYTWIEGGAVLIDVEDPAPILWFNQAGYGGYKFNTTYGTWSACGWTFAQLEQLINRLHYWNVRAVLSITAICKNLTGSNWSSNIYNWAVSRNLVFTHPDGTQFLSAEGGFSAPLDWFANFSSNDSVSGATKGETVYQLFETRLGQMISAGLQWDGIFGSEGWGSVGSWTSTGNSFIDATPNAVNQWGNSTGYHPTLPLSWSSKTFSQKVAWIQANYTVSWAGYWGMRYARDLFKGVHDLVQSLRPAQWFVGDIFSPDSTWQDPTTGTTWSGWSISVGYNSTWLAKYCSSSTYLYFIDQETVGLGQLGQQAELGKYQAYVAASVKASSPSFHTIVGMQLHQNSLNPLWIAKQEWLAQAEDYVWVNGTRYRAVDPAVCMIQYPDNSTGGGGYFRPIWNQLFNWIKSMLYFMNSASPVYLGPTYFAGDRYWSAGMWDWFNMNHTFSQWIFSPNYYNNPQYINSSMECLYLPFHTFNYFGDSSNPSGWQNVVLNSFAHVNMSVIFSIDSTTWSPSGSLGTGTFGSGASEAASISAFRLQPATVTDTQIQVLSGITDPYAKWIASGYSGNTYSVSGLNLNSYKATSGYINIANFTTSQASSLGIYYNASTGRFFYMTGAFGFNQQVILPQEMVDKGIYWASYCPVNSSESLIDMTVFRDPSTGAIEIPMMNHGDMSSSSDIGTPISSTLNINSTALGLGSISNYVFYWASNYEGSNAMTFSSWNDVTITLQGMADILIITHK
jgi:hypothetical protein